MALSSWLFPYCTTRWEDGEDGAHAMFLPLLFFDAACSDFPAWLRFRSLFNAANSRSRMSEASPRVSVSQPAMPKRLRKPVVFAIRVDRQAPPPGIPIHQHDLVLVGGEPPGLQLRVFLRPSEW